MVTTRSGRTYTFVMPPPSSLPTQQPLPSIAPSLPPPTNNDNDHSEEMSQDSDTEPPPPSPQLSPSPPPSPKRKASDAESSTPSKRLKISAESDDPTSNEDTQVLPPAPPSSPASPKRKASDDESSTPSKKPKISAESENPTNNEDPQVLPPPPPPPSPASPTRTASSDDSDDSICECCARPSKKQTLVHWPEETRPKRHRRGKDTSVITKFKVVPNISPNVKSGDIDTLQAFFDDSSDETKAALMLLSPACMNYIAHFLPKKYQLSFVSIAEKFRLETEDEIFEWPDVEERKMLKRELLETLATLHTSLIVCQDCEATHLYREEFPNCGSTWPLQQISGTFRTYTDFASIQVAMKNARNGLVSPHKHLRYLQRRTVEYIDENMCQVFFSDPFFVDDNDRLMVREQKWIIVNFECEDRKKTMWKFLAARPLRSDTILCRHLRELYSYKDLYDCGKEKVRDTAKIERCYECECEFQVDATVVGDIGCALVITTWRDLGRCVSVHDQRFQAHFAEFDGFDFPLEYGKSRRRKKFGFPNPDSSSESEEEDSSSDSDSEDDSSDSEDFDNDYKVEDKQDAKLPRGWAEDEEDEISDLPTGGIKDAYEINGFDLEDCMDEKELESILWKKHSTIRHVQKMAKLKGLSKKLNNAQRRFKYMPKLTRWGGWIDDVADVYKKDSEL